MAEDFALEQRLGNGRAVDGDEWRPRAGREFVDGPRHELLARAALPGDQDRRRRGRSHLDHAVQRLHGGPGAHDPPHTHDLPELPAQQRDLTHRLAAGGGLGDEQLQARHVHGLGQIVIGAVLHGGHCRLDCALSGQKDDRGKGHLVPQRLQERMTVQTGHDEIGQHHGRQHCDGLLEGLLAVGGLLDGITPAGEQRHKAPAGRGLVIDYKDLEAHGLHIASQGTPDNPKCAGILYTGCASLGKVVKRPLKQPFRLRKTLSCASGCAAR